MGIRVRIIGTSQTLRDALADRLASMGGIDVIDRTAAASPLDGKAPDDTQVVLIACGAEDAAGSGLIPWVRASHPDAWLVVVGDRVHTTSNEALHRLLGADESVGDADVAAALARFATSPPHSRPATAPAPIGSPLPDQSHDGSLPDGMADFAAALFDARTVVVNLVGDTCRWCGSTVHPEVDPAADTCPFCPYTIELAAPLLVPDASADSRFRDSPHVTGKPFVRFYAGAPLVSRSGSVRGVVCVLDTVRHSPPPAQAMATLQALAAHMVTLGELRRQHRMLTARSRLLAGLGRAVEEATDDLESLAGHAGLLCFEVDTDSLGVVRVSGAIEALLGYRPSWWLDQPHVWRILVATGDRPGVIAAARRCETTGEDQALSFEMVNSVGRLVRLQGRVQPAATPGAADRLRFVLGPHRATDEAVPAAPRPDAGNPP